MFSIRYNSDIMKKIKNDPQRIIKIILFINKYNKEGIKRKMIGKSLK